MEMGEEKERGKWDGRRKKGRYPQYWKRDDTYAVHNNTIFPGVVNRIANPHSSLHIQCTESMKFFCFNSLEQFSVEKIKVGRCIVYLI